MDEAIDSLVHRSKIALVVGVNNSPNTPIYRADLEYAEKDAESTAYHLRQPQCGFTLLTSPLIGEKARTVAIKHSLIALSKNRDTQDFLLFYFAGHAVPINDDIYLVTYDFEDSDVEEDASMHLSMRWLWNKLYQSSNAGCVLIILDCCYAGNIVETRDDPYKIDLRQLLEKWNGASSTNILYNRTRHILTATGYNLKAHELNGHGIMTGLLISALEGKEDEALDKEGNIEIGSLYNFLRNRMPKTQKPDLAGQFGSHRCIVAEYPHLSERLRQQAKVDELRNEVHRNILSELSQLYTAQPFDHSLCHDAAFSDLDLIKVTEFFNQKRAQQDDFYQIDVSVQDQLQNFGFLRKACPTYGALLCFGQRPSQFIAGATTRCIDWGGNNRDRFQDSREFKGSLLSQFELSRDFLRKSLRLGRVIDKEGRTEEWEIPFQVLDEALANALVHREYTGRNDSVRIEVFDDRVEISSPGDLPPLVTLELIQVEHETLPRNPQIAYIFYLHNYIEKLGTGIQRMQRFMAEAELQPPKFEVSRAKTFKVVLFRPQQTLTFLSKRDLPSQAPFDESSPNSQQSQEHQALRDLQSQKVTQGSDQLPIDIAPQEKPARAGGIRGIFSLFRREIACPRCLRSVRVPTSVETALICNECKFAIPFAYVRDFKQMPSVFVQLFGLPGAGKTTFLDMLRLHLYQLDQVWDGFYARPITQLDMDHQAILLTERAQGIMPGRTPKRGRNQNEVSILSLVNMVRWGSRFLVLMDHQGEQFSGLIVDVEEIPFLRHTPATILLISLSDLLRDGKRVNDLVTGYITSLEAYGVNFKRNRRQLVVAFSKADLITNLLPPELRDYLTTDTIYMSLNNRQQNLKLGGAEMDMYIKWMEHINGVTRQWVRETVPSGPAMLNMLDDKGIITRFTVMSATGHPLTGDGNTPTPLPRRVLDPFFWVLEFYRENGR